LCGENKKHTQRQVYCLWWYTQEVQRGCGACVALHSPMIPLRDHQD